MELWILSQNKRELYRINQVLINGVVLTAGPGKTLGVYKSCERAQEILNDIVDMMVKGAFIKKQNNSGQILDLTSLSLFIYEMPSE